MSVDWAVARLPGIDAATVAVVLGAGGAIGGETARALAAMGARVALVTRDQARSRELAAASHGDVHPFAADLADSASLRHLVDDVVATLGAPTTLINTAAIGASRRPVAEVSRIEVSTLFDVNVVGAFEAMKTVAGPMRERGGGKIVNVASVAARRVLPGASAYGASKAALISLSQHLAVDLGPHGITVNSVSPGQTPTRLRAWDEAPGGAPETAPSGTGGDAIPLRRRGLLDDYTGAILFLCSSLADYITGVDIPVEGGARLVRARSY
jgi:NAD(P)-dependent dehydrogenase (short-subunit alcohol dehydrogenase family)